MKSKSNTLWIFAVTKPTEPRFFWAKAFCFSAQLLHLRNSLLQIRNVKIDSELRSWVVAMQTRFNGRRLKPAFVALFYRVKSPSKELLEEAT